MSGIGFKQRSALFGLFIGCLLFALGACTASPSSTPDQSHTIKQASPTPTSQPAGIVLYQADWSHGLAGWQGAHGWKAEQGQLEDDSNGSAAFTLPYQPSTASYALEIRVQIVSAMKKNGGYFMLSTPRGSGKDGYQAGVSDFKGTTQRPNGDHPQAQVLLNPGSDASPETGMPRDYEPGPLWRTYRIEVRENTASLLIDGVEISYVSSEQGGNLSNAPIEFTCEQVILRVSSLRILTL